MTRQVLTIGKDGSISGLQVKPKKGFDLRQMGKASITRASEVLFDERKQTWYVEVREGAYSGKLISQEMVSDARAWNDIPMGVLAGRIGETEDALLFDEYDVAVACEIAVLDGLRRQSRL